MSELQPPLAITLIGENRLAVTTDPGWTLGPFGAVVVGTLRALHTLGTVGLGALRSLGALRLAILTIGAGRPGSLAVVCQVIECELASQGFFALIGRDVLSKCILTYDGPADRFILDF